ncbi:MAG TPA: orotate phosphoribosyltransferase [Bacteroidales bacterium]|nr:orotate phosphoribosyltransferase [Bacteroidales bacterium]HRX95433.1 orotate phosphoribosyltransferase [Bacteroidales bacterium]
MILNKETAITISEYLLQIKAIKLNVSEPFTWASGLKSPIYCDNRKTLSFPKIRTFIRQQFVEVINEEFGSVDLIAGVATGAIAHGVLVAQELGLPFVYVRSSEKKHGLENQIEGYFESGQSVVVIEDLVSTGKSSLNAVNALRAAGCDVKGMLAIFSYNLQTAIKNFEKEKCPLFTLSNYDELLKQAIESNYISENDLKSLILWRKDPEKWG